MASGLMSLWFSLKTEVPLLMESLPLLVLLWVCELSWLVIINVA